MRMFLIILTVMFVSTTSRAVGLDALFGYSFAEEFDIDSGDQEAEAAFTLGVRYKDMIGKGLGFNVGMGLDTIRDFKFTNSEVGFFLVEGNATLILDQIKVLYIFAGLNYPLIIYEDSGISDIDPVLGMQFGTGLNLSPQMGVELAYRTVNFEFGQEDSSLWGFAIRAFYTFAGVL